MEYERRRRLKEGPKLNYRCHGSYRPSPPCRHRTMMWHFVRVVGQTAALLYPFQERPSRFLHRSRSTRHMDRGRERCFPTPCIPSKIARNGAQHIRLWQGSDSPRKWFLHIGLKMKWLAVPSQSCQGMLALLRAKSCPGICASKFMSALLLMATVHQLERNILKEWVRKKESTTPTQGHAINTPKAPHTQSQPARLIKTSSLQGHVVIGRV